MPVMKRRKGNGHAHWIKGSTGEVVQNFPTKDTKTTKFDESKVEAMDWIWNFQLSWNVKFIIKATKQFKPIKISTSINSISSSILNYANMDYYQ